jgi:DNA-binding beta-propeller fold protein YncE
MRMRLKIEATLVITVCLLAVSDIGLGVSSIVQMISIVTAIPVGLRPHAVAVDSITHTAYLTGPESNNLSVVNLVANKQTVEMQVGTYPYLLGVNQARSDVYVAATDGLYVINGTSNAIITKLPFGVRSGPLALDADPASNRIYLVTSYGGMMYVIDGSTNMIINTINMTKQYGLTDPGGIYVDAQSRQIYITGSYAGGLWVVNSSSLMLVSKNPFFGNDEIVVVRKLNRIYGLYGYPQFQEYGLIVLDATTYRSIVRIPTTGGLLAVDPARSRVYLLDYGNNTLFALDGQSGNVIGSLQLQFRPGGMDVDVSTGRIFVTDPNDDNLVVLAETASQVSNTTSTQSTLAPQIPGFPFEAIVLGVVVAIISIRISRKRRLRFP